MNPAPCLPLYVLGVARSRVVHGLGVAVFVRVDDAGWFMRRTYRRNIR